MPKYKSYYGSWSHNTNKKSWLFSAKWPQSWPADYLRMICPLWLPDFLRLFRFTVTTGCDELSQMTQFLRISDSNVMLSKPVKQFSFNSKMKFCFWWEKRFALFRIFLLMFLFLPVVLGVDFYALRSLEKSSAIFLNGWKIYFSTFEFFDTLF